MQTKYFLWAAPCHRRVCHCVAWLRCAGCIYTAPLWCQGPVYFLRATSAGSSSLAQAVQWAGWGFAGCAVFEPSLAVLFSIPELVALKVACLAPWHAVSAMCVPAVAVLSDTSPAPSSEVSAILIGFSTHLQQTKFGKHFSTFWIQEHCL